MRENIHRKTQSVIPDWMSINFQWCYYSVMYILTPLEFCFKGEKHIDQVPFNEKKNQSTE